MYSYIYIYIAIHICLCIYIYIYISLSIYTHIYIYIYTHIDTHHIDTNYHITYNAFAGPSSGAEGARGQGGCTLRGPSLSQPSKFLISVIWAHEGLPLPRRKPRGRPKSPPPGAIGKSCEPFLQDCATRARIASGTTSAPRAVCDHDMRYHGAARWDLGVDSLPQRLSVFFSGLVHRGALISANLRKAFVSRARILGKTAFLTMHVSVQCRSSALMNAVELLARTEGSTSLGRFIIIIIINT